jgi:hypothetical protein
MSEYQERLRRIRASYPRAYERWSKDDENLLVRKYRAGASTLELSGLLQRQPGAIRSRLRKLDLSSSGIAQDVTGTEVSVGFSFEWEAVLRDGSQRYLFPEPITVFMRRCYGCPAVYRWTVFCCGQAEPQLVYIGATKRLCPDRLEGYLNPHGSETNLRLNKRFVECLEQGSRVCLEILHIRDVVINDLSLPSFDLSTNATRLFVENILISYYRQTGYTLLNL